MKKRKLLPISILCLAGMLIVGCGGGKSSAAPSSSGAPADSSSAAQASSSDAPASSSTNPASSSSQSPTSSSSQSSTVAVTGIALDQSSASILLGQTKTLVATISPANATNKGVTWSSEDRSVASVDQNGVVTANAVGTTKIKAKAAGGNFTAECEVTVVKTINSVSIKNKDAFTGEAGFLAGEVGSLNVEVDPKDNVAELLAAGALKVTSSDTSVAKTVGLQVTGVKAGTATIKVELFGKSDEFTLTVEDPAPGEKMSIAEAFEVAKEQAPCNTKTGKDAAITTTTFEFECAKVLAMSRYFDSKTAHDYVDTSVVALIDDGTAAIYIEVAKKETDNMPFAVGDYVNVTCRLQNYYGLFEGIHRNAKTGKSGAHMRYEDAIKLDAPTKTFTPSLNEPEKMSGEQYKAYYDQAKANSANGSKNYTLVKYAEIETRFDEARSQTDKGGYIIYDDTSSTNKDLGLQNLNEDIQLDNAPDGHVSTMNVFLIGANTSKDKSNGFIMAQTPKKPTSVAIDQENDTTVINGSTLQMTYTTTPTGSYSRKVSWAVADPQVASIDQNGLLTGLYKGNGYKSTKVTLTLGEGNDAVTSEVTIKVLGEEVHATAAQLDKESLTLTQGQEGQLTLTTTPSPVTDQAKWASSDGTVATVDQTGKVKAVKEGTATITVTLNERVSARCVVTVSKLTAATNYPGASVDLTAKLIAVNGKNAILDDGTGGIWAYGSANFSGVAAGDIVNVKGTSKVYSSGLEVDKATLTKLTDGSTVTESTATPITQEEAESYVAMYNANDGKSFFRTRKVSMRTGVIGDSMGQYYLDWTTYGVHFETNYSTGGMAAGKIYDVEGFIFKGYKSSGVTYICITVTKAEEVNVTPTGISLDKETLSLEEGKTTQLKATIAPEGASAEITWTSSNPAAATVDKDGVVTAVAPGTATIKAAISDSLYAECAVTVTAAGGGGETPTIVSLAKYSFTNTKNGTAETDGSKIKAWFTKDSGDDILDSISDASNVYPGANGGSGDTSWDSGNLLKIGKASAGGSLKIKTTQNVSKLVITGYAWKNTLNVVVNGEKVTGALKDNLANKANVAAGNVGSFEISFDAADELAISTENTALVATAIEFFGPSGSITPVEVKQPLGNFSGYAVSAADGSNIFVDLALANSKAFVEVGSLYKDTVDYTFDNTTGVVTIALGAYGTFTGTYDETNNKLTNCGIEGAVAAYITNNNQIELKAAENYWNCDGTTEELRNQFQRRYRTQDSGWSVDNNESHTDRIVRDETNFVSGTGAMSIRPYGGQTNGKGNVVGLSLLRDFETAKAIKNIGFWVYNSSDSDISLRTWVYTQTGLAGAVEIGGLTAKANGWTYCRMGFEKTIYNFNISNWNGSANALVFDDIVLF